MTGFIDLANGCKTAVLALLLLLNLYQFLMVNPESGETVMIPYQEPDGTYVHVSLELNAGGESYIWLLLELEECMVWLVDGRLMV